MLNEFEDQDYVETAPEAFSDEKSRSATGWNELAAQQRADRETAAMAENQKMFDQFVAIEDGAKQQQAEIDHGRAIAFAAGIRSAKKNGGFSDRSLSTSLSQAFGRPVYGMQIVKDIDIGNGPESVVAIYGPAKDPQTGKARVAPVAMLGSGDAVKLLKSAGLGDTMNGAINDFIDSGYIGKMTDDQRAAAGLSRPTAPVSTGGTVISAAGMRALRGEPRPRSTISVFSNVGGDGKVGTGTRSATIRPDGTREEVTTGTRREDAPGKWKVLSVSPDPSDEKGKRQIRRYENDKTGEVVDVPEGSSLRDVLRSGGSERERIAQMNNDSREKRAQVTAEATRYKADMAREIAEIRARQQTGKAGREATANDAKRLAEIVGDYKLDEATRNAAKEALDNTLASLGKATSSPAQKGGDEDITLPDGSQGKKHNGKTYRLKGMDKDGNKQWELVK